MKSRKAMKAISLLLVCMLFAGILAACVPAHSTATTPDTTASTGTTPPATTPEETGVTFPLKEKFTFKIMFKGNIDFDNLLPKCTYYQQLVKDTNVEFEWIHLGDEPMATLNSMLAAGSEGDVIFGGVLNDSTMSDLAYGGFLMPIEDYITDPNIMPNYVNRGLKDMPQALGVMTMPDGHIYSVARLDTNAAGNLESPMHINGAWLEQLNMDPPETLQQFEQMLVGFRDNDMNGNDNPNDEIPLLIANSAATPYSTPQAMMGIWGLATKNNALDSYTTIRDGVVQFAPMTDAYKEAVSTIGRWFKEGLIWSEMYTANTESFNAKMTNEVPLYGVLLHMAPHTNTSYYKDLITIPYPKAEGYEPRAYVNPGMFGYKNTFTLTRNAKNPEIILAWLDQMYSLEGSTGVYYNLPNDEELGAENRYDVKDGKYIHHTMTAEQTAYNKEHFPTLSDLWGAFVFLRSNDDYENDQIKLTASQVRQREIYSSSYADIINKEVWPRPYYTAEDNERANQLRTDVFNIVTLYEAQWTTGQSDVNADWDKYVGELKAAGVDELIQILQRSYDIYMEAMEKYR